MTPAQALFDPEPASLRELINPLMSFIAFPSLRGGAALAQPTHPPAIADAAGPLDANGRPA